MAASSGTHSYGSTLGIGSASNSFTTVTEVIDMDSGGPTVGSTKFTHLNSDNGFHEYKPGLGEGGEVSLTINYDKTQYNTLYGYLRTTKWIKITVADGGNSIFQGHITALPIKIPDDDRCTDDIKIKVTGKPTWATS